MLTDTGERVPNDDSPYGCIVDDEFSEHEPLPDLDDPATLGCIEHGLVPEALGDQNTCLCFDPVERKWYVYSPLRDECFESASSKAEALVAALETAP